MIDIYHLHNNPDEWITPDQYIPERFDPESPYYLTPYGNKRHPMSYGPFLGGKRICLGKTFAENMGKSMTALIIGQLDFEFVENEFYTRKPNTSFHLDEPNVLVKIKKVI